MQRGQRKTDFPVPTECHSAQATWSSILPITGGWCIPTLAKSVGILRHLTRKIVLSGPLTASIPILLTMMIIAMYILLASTLGGNSGQIEMCVNMIRVRNSMPSLSAKY